MNQMFKIDLISYKNCTEVFHEKKAVGLVYS